MYVNNAIAIFNTVGVNNISSLDAGTITVDASGASWGNINYDSIYLDDMAVYTGRSDVLPPVVSGNIIITPTPSFYNGDYLVDTITNTKSFSVDFLSNYNVSMGCIYVTLPVAWNRVNVTSTTTSTFSDWTTTHN